MNGYSYIYVYIASFERGSQINTRIRFKQSDGSKEIGSLCDVCTMTK